MVDQSSLFVTRITLQWELMLYIVKLTRIGVPLFHVAQVSSMGVNKRGKRGQRRHPPYTLYSIGNLSRVILKTTDPTGDQTTANQIARMCPAWMTHVWSHASFTNRRRTKWRKTRRAILLFVLSKKTTTERFQLTMSQRNGNYSQTKSSVPPKDALMNLVFES